MANDTKRILVVLPTLGDRLETLQETLETIETQRQTASLRLIVVAPATAIQARELAKQFGAEVVDDPKTGISEAIKFSSFPTPTINGLSFLIAYKVSFSSSKRIASA